MMELEELCLFDVNRPVGFPLAMDKRSEIERKIQENVGTLAGEPQYKWKSTAGEEVLRISIDPFVLELVFLERVIGLYGTAPAWARLLFTKARKDQLALTTENVLGSSGFAVKRKQLVKAEAHGWAARRAKKQG